MVYDLGVHARAQYQRNVQTPFRNTYANLIIDC